MNPCPCGNYGDPVKACTCSESTVSRYQRRISGPLLDRIDIFVEVPRIDYDKLASLKPAETSAAVRGRIDGARQLQRERFAGRAAQANADVSPADVREFAQTEIDEQAKAFLRLATTQLS